MQRPTHPQSVRWTRILMLLACAALVGATFGAGAASAKPACLESGDSTECHAEEVCPANVTAEPQRDGIHLAWTPVDGAEGYAIHRAKEGGDLTEVDEVGENATTHRDAPVRPAVTYTYTVIPQFAEGDFETCPTVEATSIPFFDSVVPIALAAIGTLGALLLLRRP